MGRSVFETVLGAFVLCIAGLFLGFAYSSSNVQRVTGYALSANFPMVDGVKEGTDVKLNGVKVGSISGLQLLTDPGPNEFLVNVMLTVRPDIRLPVDTMAMVASESLLGGKYLSLEPGVEEEMIKTDGSGRITRTQAPMRLDDLIGQLIYSNKRGSSDNSQGSSPAPSPTPSGAAPPAKAAPAHP